MQSLCSDNSIKQETTSIVAAAAADFLFAAPGERCSNIVAHIKKAFFIHSPYLKMHLQRSYQDYFHCLAVPKCFHRSSPVIPWQSTRRKMRTQGYFRFRCALWFKKTLCSLDLWAEELFSTYVFLDIGHARVVFPRDVLFISRSLVTTDSFLKLCQQPKKRPPQKEHQNPADDDLKSRKVF